MKDQQLLMIPGPIEFDAKVLAKLSKPTTSHVAPSFIEDFGQAIERMRELFQCHDGQPFIVAGSGTFSMDMACANLVEPGDRALVVNTGYFGDRMGDILERYGASVTHVRGSIGGIPDFDDVEKTLKVENVKLMMITHVDTSTGVLIDVKSLSKIAKQYNTLVVVDGVCSVAGEELKMSEWGVDVAFTASQKAVGVPPGLGLLVAGPNAIESFRNRKTPVPNYYADWENWLPIMQNYEARKPSYFGTPAVNLIQALNLSLEQILTEGLEARIKRHEKLSQAFKAGIRGLGLKQVPLMDEYSAHTMTAPYYPDGIIPAQFLTGIKEEGVILAGGLHPEIKARYFRIGHMGSISFSDILTTIAAIEISLANNGYEIELGGGVTAAIKSYNE
jgi:alanine-glyoxylate transaminase/serine-glyoxylate transaminase/serine-pyruvate transaminase